MGVFRVFIGSVNQAVYDFTAFYESEDKAMDDAWSFAVEDYESYEGLHGIRDLTQVMEEEGIEDEDEAMDIYFDERNNTLDYYVEECTEDQCEGCEYKEECRYEW